MWFIEDFVPIFDVVEEVLFIFRGLENVVSSIHSIDIAVFLVHTLGYRQLGLDIILDCIQALLFSFISQFVPVAQPGGFCLLIWVLLVGLTIELIVCQVGGQVHFLLLDWFLGKIIGFNVIVFLDLFRTREAII